MYKLMGAWVNAGEMNLQITEKIATQQIDSARKTVRNARIIARLKLISESEIEQAN